MSATVAVTPVAAKLIDSTPPVLVKVPTTAPFSLTFPEPESRNTPEDAVPVPVNRSFAFGVATPPT